MVQDLKRGGYPMRCPTPPRWYGVFVNPRGEGWPVDACDEHAEGLDQFALGSNKRCSRPALEDARIGGALSATHPPTTWLPRHRFRMNAQISAYRRDF